MHHSNQELTVHLFFGNACNMKCRYCLQETEGQNHKPNVDEFLEKFIHYVESNNITLHEVHYQGGEPLLYWGYIKQIISKLNERYPGIKLHRITTNATLIDDDYVEFCNSLANIHTVVSLHEFDINKEVWQRVGKLNSVVLSAVIHKQMPTVSSYYQEWQNACNSMGKFVTLAPFPMHATGSAQQDTWLTKDDVEHYFQDLIFNIYPLYREGNEFAKGVMQNIMYYAKQQSSKSLEPHCHNKHSLAVDLFGNTYACHHNTASKYIIGNILDRNKIIPLYDPKSERYFVTEACQNCEVLSICHGGCYLSHTHDVECYWQKLFYAFYQFVNRNEISNKGK